MELQILFIIYRNKCFKTSAGYHSEKLKRILRKKYNRDFDTAIANLGKRGCIGAIKMDEPKYYIADLVLVHSLLKDHGFNVTPLGGGRTHHFE